MLMPKYPFELFDRIIHYALTRDLQGDQRMLFDGKTFWWLHCTHVTDNGTKSFTIHEYMQEEIKKYPHKELG